MDQIIQKRVTLPRLYQEVSMQTINSLLARIETVLNEYMAKDSFCEEDMYIENNLITRVGYLATARCKLTAEGGLAVLLTNGTGADSVKGSLVAASSSADNTVMLQTNEYDTIGAVYESGVANGSEVWVVISGRAQVLYKDSTASTRGNLLIADAVDGRGSDISTPGFGIPAVDTHFKECGHVLETKSGGTDVLVYCNLHFN